MKLCELRQDDRDAMVLDIRHNKGRRLKDIVRARSRKNNGQDKKMPTADAVDMNMDPDNSGSEFDASGLSGLF